MAEFGILDMSLRPLLFKRPTASARARFRAAGLTRGRGV